MFHHVDHEEVGDQHHSTEAQTLDKVEEQLQAAAVEHSQLTQQTNETNPHVQTTQTQVPEESNLAGKSQKEETKFVQEMISTDPTPLSTISPASTQSHSQSEQTQAQPQTQSTPLKLSPLQTSATVATDNIYTQSLTSSLVNHLAALQKSESKENISEAVSQTDGSLKAVLDKIKSLPTAALHSFLSSILQSSSASTGHHIHNLIVSYLLFPQGSGHDQDPVCQFLYELYVSAHHKTNDSTATAAADDKTSSIYQRNWLPVTQQFVLSFIPVMAFIFLWRQNKLFNVSNTTSHSHDILSSESITSPSTVSGFAACLLAVYNRERVLCLKAQQYIAQATTSNATTTTLPTWLDRVLQVPSVPPLFNSHIYAQTLPAQTNVIKNQIIGNIPNLPAITDLSQTSINNLIHVCLWRYVHSLAIFPLWSQQQFCYCAYLLADSGFSKVNTLTHCIDDALPSLLSDMTWNINWLQRITTHTATSSPSTEKPRFIIQSPILLALVQGLAFCSQYPGTKPLALLGLRQVHCRAIEEVSSDVLLQTSVLLDDH